MRLVVSAVLALTVSPIVSAAQAPARGPDATIDAATRGRVIQGLLERLDEGYVFPKKAREMVRAIRERSKRGAYDRIVSAHAFADTLTQDLQAVSHDRHLEVAYISRGVVDDPPSAAGAAPSSLGLTGWRCPLGSRGGSTALAMYAEAFC